jgi:ABC-type phosphate transport system permease subunit
MTMERTCKPVAAETINKLTFKDKMRAYKRSPLSLILLLFVCGAALITMLTLLYLIVYILVKGIPYITPDLFSFTYTSDNVSLMPALISTIVMTIIALVIALPLGIGAAIYSVEYAKRGNKLVQLVRITTETLSGIPSIVYGLFGYLCFVTALHWGYSLLAAYHAHNGGGAHLGAGFLPRGQLRAWRGQTAHGVSHRAAERRAGHFVRRNFGRWPRCG